MQFGILIPSFYSIPPHCDKISASCKEWENLSDITIDDFVPLVIRMSIDIGFRKEK